MRHRKLGASKLKIYSLHNIPIPNVVAAYDDRNSTGILALYDVTVRRHFESSVTFNENSSVCTQNVVSTHFSS